MSTHTIEVEVYSPAEEEYHKAEVYVDVAVNGQIDGWSLKSLRGTDVMGNYTNKTHPSAMQFILNIDPITDDMVEAACTKELGTP